MEMLRQFRSCWAEINLDAIEHNIAIIKSITKAPAKMIAVIKADAYGHGSVPIAQSAIKKGVEILAVSGLDEALELRQANITTPIFILGYSEPSYAPYIVTSNISQTVYNFEMAKALSEAAIAHNVFAKIHIKIDSGMGRIGFLPNQESYQEIERILNLPNIIFEGLFTHFSSADEISRDYTHMQYSRFKTAVDKINAMGFKPTYIHCANSATIIEYPEYHFDCVRAGIILYGVYPSKEVNQNLNLKPAMSVKTKISNIKSLPKNEAISYNRKYLTSKTTKIATISIGYADGYPRKLANTAEVLVQGKRAPVVGNICMDQCMVDVSHIDDVNIGDEVVIFGRQGEETILVEELAQHLDTIAYEVLCDIGRRLPRLYVSNGKVESVVNYLLK